MPSTIAPAIATSPATIDKMIRTTQAMSFPIKAWYCIGSVIAFASLCHFTSLFYRLLYKPSNASGTSSRNAIQYRRLPAATLSTFRAFAFRSTLSIGDTYTLNVIELFLTAAYMAIVFIWSLVDSNARTGRKYDPHYWANTAGHIVATQIPLVIALGMKNNPISLLTGISFNKLNILHRMAARVLVILIWVHASGRLMLGMTGATAWSQPWIQFGALAATSLSVLSLISIRPLRNRTYEVFVAAHFILSLVFLIAVYFHARGTNKSFYIWPSFLIWGLDRLIRVLRVVIFNFGYFGLKSKAELDAHVDVLSPHFIRITLRRPHYFHWSPGQCAYVTIPGISPFQAHPFTISSVDLPFRQLPSGPEKQLEIQRPSHRLLRSNEIVLLCRVRKGFTERLRNAARDDQSWKILLDGPYGTPPTQRGYETVVLIAGGSGVTFTLPQLLDVVCRARSGEQSCRRLVFIWAFRDIGIAEAVSDVLVPILRDLPPFLMIEIHLYATGVPQDVQAWETGSSDVGTEAKESTHGNGGTDPAFFQLPMVSFKQGRPDFKQLMKTEIERATGEMIVNACGPQSLADGVRSTLSESRFVHILKGGPLVTLHIETFGMVLDS